MVALNLNQERAEVIASVMQGLSHEEVLDVLELVVELFEGEGMGEVPCCEVLRWLLDVADGVGGAEGVADG